MVILTQGTSYNRKFKMISSADHITSGTRSSPVVRIAKSGTGFTHPGNAAIEQNRGWYQVLLNATDTNTIGDLAFNITGTLCDDTDFVDQIVVVTLNDSVRLGMTSLPNATANTTGGLPVLPLFIVGGTVGKVTDTVGSVTGSVGSVTTPVFVQGGTVGKITNFVQAVLGGTVGGNNIASAVWDKVRTDHVTNNTFGQGVFVVGGTITATSSNVFVLGGTVGKVTNTVAILTSNADKTGYSLSSPQTIDITGNITGNLSGSVGSVSGAVGSVSGSVNSVTTPVFVQGGTIGKISGSIFITGGTVGKVTDSVGSVTGNVGGDVVGNVQGNVNGSVNSVTGAVGSVTGAVGSVTGNVGGNVVGSVNSVVVPVVTGTSLDKTGYSLSSGQLFVKKNTALANFMFPMIDSTDNITLKTGLTVTGEVSIDGAAFGALTNSVSELSSGVYKVDLAAADVNGTNIMLKFTASGADTRLIEIITQS